MEANELFKGLISPFLYWPLNRFRSTGVSEFETRILDFFEVKFDWRVALI